MSPPFEAYRRGRLEAVQARYRQAMEDGFPCRFVGADGDVVAETLQLRDDTDRTNWLTLKDSCNDAMFAGFGAYPITLPLRCTSNRSYTPSWAEMAAILRRMKVWGGLCLANLWRLKALIEAAPTRQALLAIDLEDGWPGDDGTRPVPRLIPPLAAQTGAFVLT